MRARAEVHPRMESNRTNEFRGRRRATCVLQNQFCNVRTEWQTIRNPHRKRSKRSDELTEKVGII